MQEIKSVVTAKNELGNRGEPKKLAFSQKLGTTETLKQSYQENSFQSIFPLQLFSIETLMEGMEPIVMDEDEFEYGVWSKFLA